MSNETTTFRVTLEFEVTVDPIGVPDADSFQNLKVSKETSKKAPDEKEFRAALKAKGLSQDEIEKFVDKANKTTSKTPGAASKKGNGSPPDYQMLLYPQYEDWGAAQRLLQDKILRDEGLCSAYLREMVRDLTRGEIESLIAEKYGDPDIDGVLEKAIDELSPVERARLKTDEKALLFDETELLDSSVNCRFKELTVRRS